MPALFKPSKANPPVMAPSPMMATDWRSSSPFILAATAMPKAAEIDVEECPVPKASYLLSLLFGKPLMAFVLPVGREIVPPAGQNLMRISLMADIPYDVIVRGIKHVM